MPVIDKKEDIVGVINLKVEGKTLEIPLSDVVFFESFGNYVKVVTGQKMYITQFTTKGIEEILPGQHFIRIHKSYIINKHHLSHISDDAVVINNLTLPIGKTYKQYLVKTLRKCSGGDFFNPC